MGQGSLTALPLILAEELDADWSKVVIVPAPPIDKIYGNPGFGGVMHTASSAAVTGFFTDLRTFGAQVRAVLLDNVAKHWNVPRAELSTEPSIVVHAKSGRRMGYGEIVAFAEIPSVAPEIKPEALKKTSDFTLIGHDVMRIELPTKVNGSAACVAVFLLASKLVISEEWLGRKRYLHFSARTASREHDWSRAAWQKRSQKATRRGH